MTTVTHVNKSRYDIYIGRANGDLPESKWANPFVIGKDGTRDEVIAKYEEWIRGKPELMAALPELKGKVLGCWCRPVNRCHGDVLARLIDGEVKEVEIAPEAKIEMKLSPEINITPVFYDHSSNKSLLTYWKAKDCAEHGPKSIVQLCKDAGLKTCFGVSDNFLTFPEAQKNLSKEGIEFTFGLETWICDDATQKVPESVKNEHKIIIRADNSQGYHDLTRIYSAIHTNRDHFYYKFRFDMGRLKPLWTENLTLILPFFDSFVHRNTLSLSSIVPDLPTAPLIFREVDSGLPFHGLIDKALDLFNQGGQYKEQRVKTIFYVSKAQAKSWMNYRSINLRSTFQKPQMDFCCSDNFSWQDWVTLSSGLKP